MAKLGSSSWALRKCAAASSYSKLWSCARPWRKSACAAGEPELGKETSPTEVDCAWRLEPEIRRRTNAVWSSFIKDCLVAEVEKEESNAEAQRTQRIRREREDYAENMELGWHGGCGEKSELEFEVELGAARRIGGDGEAEERRTYDANVRNVIGMIKDVEGVQGHGKSRNFLFAILLWLEFEIVGQI